LKSNIPIKYLYDKIVTNPSKALVYMLESDILYLIENGIIIDKIIITEEEDQVKYLGTITNFFIFSNPI
jgi:hypothetical protein